MKEEKKQKLLMWFVIFSGFFGISVLTIHIYFPLLQDKVYPFEFIILILLIFFAAKINKIMEKKE